ncbi:hypothetical protein ZIOFF_022424 [Zingiber officinale]|uniref:Pentatricopeptide repeat-containing protein n=1 Tax=Zingiber officinale TaxID=94328 RepID=A0A8J5H2V7_ZINOF|nr:hypothetical protein ZIOFF_022424 [Zingiber officinale]
MFWIEVSDDNREGEEVGEVDLKVPVMLLVVLYPAFELEDKLSIEEESDDLDAEDLQISSSKNATESNIGKNISIAEKQIFLVNTICEFLIFLLIILLTLEESKEAVYGTLDAWVAWENSFPLVSLKKAILVLEKEEQWHRVVQVIKWILSKGQGTTMGTYEQLIRALEKDNRAEEAHRIWMKKISHDLHSVPWRFCDLMISIYYRNNMLERLVKLF